LEILQKDRLTAGAFSRYWAATCGQVLKVADDIRRD